MRRLTILLTLAASLISSINPCPAAPPIFLRTTGFGAQASGSTYSSADSVLGYSEYVDDDSVIGEMATASAVSAVNSGDNSATANFQSVTSAGLDGQTTISAPTLAQGVVTLQVEEFGSATGYLGTYSLWDAHYVVDDEGGLRDSSAAYLVSIAISFSWTSGATPEDVISEMVQFNSPEDGIKVVAGGSTVRVRYLGEGRWQATNGIVTDTYEIEDNSVNIVITKEVTLGVNDTVSVEGILGFSAGASIDDGTYLGSGTLDVDVTLMPVTP